MFAIESTIGCRLTLIDGDLLASSDRSMLTLEKDFWWMGGKFRPEVNCAGDGQSAGIIITLDAHIGGTATLEPNAKNVPATGLPNDFKRAKLVSAIGGIGNVVPNMDPSLTLKNPPGVEFGLKLKKGAIGNPAAEYDLVKAFDIWDRTVGVGKYATK